MMIWVGLGVLVAAAGLIGWWLVLGADKTDLFPTNHLKQMRREDGGLGPIARADKPTRPRLVS